MKCQFVSNSLVRTVNMTVMVGRMFIFARVRIKCIDCVMTTFTCRRAYQYFYFVICFFHHDFYWQRWSVNLETALWLQLWTWLSWLGGYLFLLVFASNVLIVWWLPSRAELPLTKMKCQFRNSSLFTTVNLTVVVGKIFIFARVRIKCIDSVMTIFTCRSCYTAK